VTGPRHGGWGDGEDLLRPYLGAWTAEASAAPGEADVGILRPFVLTSGRVVPADTSLEIEAQVVASQQGRVGYRELAFEQRDIVLLCHTTMSVAEVAARLRYHIGVARVLIADLAVSGHVIVRRPDVDPALDLDMIERVIRALEAIR
jgi:hypothetical protein